MRLVNVFSVFLAVAVCLLVPQRQALASDGDSFIAWALEQGEGLDRTWSRITTDATPGAATGNSTAAAGRNTTAPARWARPAVTNWNVSSGSTKAWSPHSEDKSWVHSKSGFIHKGDLQRFPLSTRNRSGPSRGQSKLRNPARAHLGIRHDYRRIPNARTPSKSFFHGRSGKSRITASRGTRISPFRQRSRVSTRSSRRTSRPR